MQLKHKDDVLFTLGIPRQTSHPELYDFESPWMFMLNRHGDIGYKDLAKAIIEDRGGQKRDAERSIVMDELISTLTRQAQ